MDKVTIQTGKPFPPEGYVEERQQQLSDILDRRPEWTLEQRLRESKLSRIKSKRVRAAKMYGEMIDKLNELVSELKKIGLG